MYKRQWLLIFGAFLTVLSLPFLSFAFPSNAENVRGGINPTSCDDLSGVPETPAVDYFTQVQPLFDRPSSQNGCLTCHINGSSGGLNIAPNVALDNLVCADAANGNASAAGLHRVQPFEPENSWLFIKLNCNIPDGGSRMPLGGLFTVEEQRLVFDWIRQGANNSGDVVFNSRFEAAEICQ